MPFWQRVKRCENCKHWQRADPSDVTAECHAPTPARLPFWQRLLPAQTTGKDDGKDCDAYSHIRQRAHPLDHAGELVIRAQVGDRIPMRTYGPGHVSHTEARVIRHTLGACIVEMHNTPHRIRYRAAQGHRPGTVIGLERWGVDMNGRVIRATVKREDMTRAKGMLAGVKVGDTIRLLGYPPFDGMTKDVRVSVVEKTRIAVRLGRGKQWMHRTGPHAGLLINNPLWVLDTTEVTNEQTE